MLAAALGGCGDGEGDPKEDPKEEAGRMDWRVGSFSKQRIILRC